MNFDLLCVELGIDSHNPLSKNMELLKRWFQKNISQDQEFTGTEAEQWDRYKEVSESYFKFIVPALEGDIELPTPLLDGQSTISVLVETGLDGVLLKVQPNKDVLNKPNNYGQTPLHRAAIAGWVNTTKALLSLGAEVDSVNVQNQTPLFSALTLPVVCSDQFKSNKVAVFKLLKAAGHQSLSHQDQSGNTILLDFGQNHTSKPSSRFV